MKMASLVLIAVYSLWHTRCDTSLFISRILLAELRLIRKESGFHLKEHLGKGGKIPTERVAIGNPPFFIKSFTTGSLLIKTWVSSGQLSLHFLHIPRLLACPRICHRPWLQLPHLSNT
jgi:hypothetical protein